MKNLYKSFVVAASLLVATPSFAKDCHDVIRSWIDTLRFERYNGKSTVDLKIELLQVKNFEFREAINRLLVLTEIYPSMVDGDIVRLEAINCDFWNEQ